MKIEYPQKKLSKASKMILKMLETKPCLVVEFDDGPESYQCRKELLEMNGFSCLWVHQEHNNLLRIMNDDVWPSVCVPEVIFN